MRVLINMDMPKSCCECPLVKLSQTGESLVCNYMLSTVPWDETPFNRETYIITYLIHGFGLEKDWCVFGIKPLKDEKGEE